MLPSNRGSIVHAPLNLLLFRWTFEPSGVVSRLIWHSSYSFGKGRREFTENCWWLFLERPTKHFAMVGKRTWFVQSPMTWRICRWVLGRMWGKIWGEIRLYLWVGCWGMLGVLTIMEARHWSSLTWYFGLCISYSPGLTGPGFYHDKPYEIEKDYN